MEITYASPSFPNLSTAAMPSPATTSRTVRVIPLQHPTLTTSSSSSPSSSLLAFSRWASKLRRMTWLECIELLLPCCRWIRNYKWKEFFQVDLMAGITVGVMLVPQSMSYAKLAGLQPICGLYSGFLPIFVYAIFGSSRQLAVGPVALVSLLVSNVLSGIVDPSSELYTEMAILLALMVGILECIMGLLRLGWLIRFISHSVISGFTTASAIVIGLSQVKYFLGYDIDRSSKIIPLVKSIIAGADKVELRVEMDRRRFEDLLLWEEQFACNKWGFSDNLVTAWVQGMVPANWDSGFDGFLGKFTQGTMWVFKERTFNSLKEN